MKKLVFVVFAMAVFGCAKKEEGKPLVTIKTDTIQTPKVGADADAHGCKTSAGYTWSELRGECVRVFEVGTRLDPMDDTLHVKMSAFVIFKDDKAEVFMQEVKSPIILERKSEGDTFVKDDWQLIPWKGYVLKKDGVILFTGK